MQRHGIDRQVQRTSSGSTPHEPVTIPQILSSRSPAFDRPRQSTLRYPALVSNRPTVHHVRRDPPPIHQPLHRRPTCRGGSIPITHLSRGSQIAIAPAARPSFPQARFPPLEAFGRRPRARGPTVMGPASETLHGSRSSSSVIELGETSRRAAAVCGTLPVRQIADAQSCLLLSQVEVSPRDGVDAKSSGNQLTICLAGRT